MRTRVFTLVAICLLALIASGCRTVVARSGDATIKKWPQFPYHVAGSECVRLVLPAVSLAHPGTNVLRVRDLPSRFVGVFKYDLCLPVKYEEDAAEGSAPWKDSQITIAFRRLDGVEVCKQSLNLGAARHEPGRGWDGYCVEWVLPPNSLAPPPDTSYDIVVVVERPSRRSSDRILLGAYGVYRQKS
jgi:hypothetical protein